jgi:ribosomal protein S17E
MKTLEKSKLTKEEIQRIVSKQEEIFKLDFDSNKIEIEQYQSYQEQR